MRLPADVKEDLDYISVRSKRSASSIAIEAISNDVTCRAKRTRMIEEAKASERKGNFISHAAVGKWVTSLGTKNELPIPEPDIFKYKN